MSDIKIAQAAKKVPIIELAHKHLGIAAEQLTPYGHYKAKINLDYIESLKKKKSGNLILVTAISPTPAGEGKTTTSVGLGDALNRLGHKTITCLREPSLGPCFGIKGGAAGGGFSQVVPMEDINLHFTGDFHAITSAHNLLAAMLDNHITHGNQLRIDQNRITFKRALDMNDRALREIVVGLGGSTNGYVRESGFDISVASEVMAIFCLATSLQDLKEKLGRIVVGYRSNSEEPITAASLKANGAMTALLRDALSPNIVQTLENNLAFVHGGPFANIAHGCNSVMATQAALRLSDYVVTEAGFGADLGAEKFIDIKTRIAGLEPKAVVLVATVRALKYHGGIEVAEMHGENLSAIQKGFANLERHLHNITQEYGLPCVVCVNRFVNDTQKELELVQQLVNSVGGSSVVANHWSEGGQGAENLAALVQKTTQSASRGHKYVYKIDSPLWVKIESIAKSIYGAEKITASKKIRDQIAEIGTSYPSFCVCIAKTQTSFSTDPNLRGAPEGHIVEINEVRVCAGAGFVVAIAGNMMTMPGLPKIPAAEKIDVNEEGQITGLF